MGGDREFVLINLPSSPRTLICHLQSHCLPVRYHLFLCLTEEHYLGPVQLPFLKMMPPRDNPFLIQTMSILRCPGETIPVEMCIGFFKSSVETKENQLSVTKENQLSSVG
ncbi:UNVERIFIED_CONTAM: hypothetical protein K2H54_061623 [Gekko kuhli]